MTERPIIFSAALVRAVLDGRKTMTRRVVRHHGDFLGAGGRSSPDWDDPSCWGWEDPENPGHFLVLDREPKDRQDQPFRCPYGAPGDRLWVREAWAPAGDGGACWYRAGVPVYAVGSRREPGAWDTYDRLMGVPLPPDVRWRPAIHMPRWASRVTLALAVVRVERVRAITEDDARAEGVGSWLSSLDGRAYDHAERQCIAWTKRLDPAAGAVSVRGTFAALWDSLNGNRPGCGWDADPWVWVLTFRRVKP